MPHRAFTPVRKENGGKKSNITSNRDACYEEKQVVKRMARDWEKQRSVDKESKFAGPGDRTN